MTYFAPYIDGAGFHTPLYSDITTYFTEQYTGIYGQSVSDNISTSDVQSISIFALAINDAYAIANAVFNGMSPMTAIGAQQDSLYKLNGIAREPATNSTVQLRVSGTPLLVLTNRVAQDANGYLWDLPASFQIPVTGTITVPATCETSGSINAAINTITVMSNPISGWTSVSNPVAANPGVPVETDSAFRARQSLSVVLPSQSLVTGTLAAIAAVPGVTRYATGPCIENPTGTTDTCASASGPGNPPHSISMVVEGGTDQAVADAIYLNKTPGCFTNGTTTVSVADPVTGTVMPISFFRPTYVPIFVNCVIKNMGGSTSATTTAVQTAIVNYLNSLQIGETLTISALYGAALSVMPNLSEPMFSITTMQAGLSSGSLGTVDIPVNFNQVVQGITANVTVTGP